MKKLATLAIISATLFGCTSNPLLQGTSSIPAKTPRPTYSASQVMPSAENGINIYRNMDLGIAFEYPTSIGRLWENAPNEHELFAIKFLEQDGGPAALDVWPDESQTLRTCTDILANGFAGGDRTTSHCESMKVDNQPIIVVTFTANADAKAAGMESHSMGLDAKHVFFQTKKGVWNFVTTDPTQYDLVVTMAKSLKYLQ